MIGNGEVLGLKNNTLIGMWGITGAYNKSLLNEWSISGDPYFKSVVLLLHGNGISGAQNNTFLDSSINNFAITRIGTGQGSPNPYGDLWSNYFDGSGDLLSIASNTAFEMGTENFTWECWVYVTSFGNGFTVMSHFTSGTGARVAMFVDSTVGLSCDTGSGLGLTFSVVTAVTIPINAWTHCALVRDGSTFSLYVNGILNKTATSSASYVPTNQVFTIGDYNSDYSTGYGYISNVRVVKGTALYTSNFTPSNTPLTAVSGTSLLTCQNNRFIDNSSNNFAITVTGNPTVQRFSPYNISSTSYSAGSMLFNANGSYLRTPSNAALTPSNGAFTWEVWFYPRSFGQVADGGDTILYTGATGGLLIGRPPTSQGGWGVGTVGVGWSLLTATLPINGQWNHMAVSRTGTGTNQAALWLNGNRVAVGTVSQTFVQGTVDVSSGSTSYDIDGWMADYRLIKGSAIYDPASTTYTIPTAPLTAITNTSLLWSGLNAAIYDSSSNTLLETVANAQINTSITKFGTNSVAFDGVGDALTSPYSPNIDLINLSWTFEAWVYPTVANTAGTRIFSTGGGAVAWSSTTGIHILIQTSNGTSSGGFLNFQISNNTASPLNVTSTSTVPINQWTFISVAVSGTTAYLGVNGNVISGSVSGKLRPSTNPTLALGTIPGETTDTNRYAGYIEDVRLTNGVARYTSNYTVPIAPFPVSS